MRKQIIIILLSLFFFTSCDKTNIIYNNYNAWTDDLEKEKKSRINFNASLLLYDATRTEYSRLGGNRYITVYAYEYEGDFVTSVKYITNEDGTLSPLSDPMYLKRGDSYSFYAVGIYDYKTVVPIFTNGVYSDIQYKVDYLWSDTCNVTPTADTNNYNLYLSHSVTQISIVLSIDSGVTLSKLNNMEITPSSISGLDWSLYYGNIGPATSINSSLYTMDITQKNDSTYSGIFTMPPLELSNSTSMDISLNTIVSINNIDYTKTFTTELEIPDNALKSNYSYQYDVLLRTDTVLLTQVNVSDWVPVVDGTPIIPDIQ